MNARELRDSLRQIQTDLQAAMPKDSAERADRHTTLAIKALLDEVSAAYPDNPIVKAIGTEPVDELRIRQALAIVGQLLVAVPEPGISIG